LPITQLRLLVLWCQNRAAHAGSRELARRTRMHWSAAQFQVTLFQTQNARVRRVNCVRVGKSKMPNVFLLSLFYFSVAIFTSYSNSGT
jgi:hypothetical protein